MKRVAFFVEGLSEQLFVEKLMTEILGSHNIAIEKRKMQGGARSRLRITQIGAPTFGDTAQYYILIVDCGGETTVQSYIREQRDSLLKKDYKIIYGILDVRPNWTREEIPKLERSLYYKLPQRDLETRFILSVMEIESWFLAEENHYSKIHRNISLKLIWDEIGFDPLSDTELQENPSGLLHEIYQTQGLAYNKNRKSISRTVNKLDYANLYFNVKERNKSLGFLIDEIDTFILS